MYSSTMKKARSTSLSLYLKAGFILCASCWILLSIPQVKVLAFEMSDDNSDDDCSDLVEEIRKLVTAGALSAARYVAFHSLLDDNNEASRCKAQVLEAYTSTADSYLKGNNLTEYLRLVDHSFDDDHQRRNKAKRDGTEFCQSKYNAGDSLDTSSLNYIMTPEDWDRCCSLLPQQREQEKTLQQPFVSTQDSHDPKNLLEEECSQICCEFSRQHNSWAHVRLPALFEPAVRLWLSADVGVLELEQESFLRPYDPAGVLWPGGYLLALCVADPVTCGIEDVLHRALSNYISSPASIIELGAGIGAPSIALDLYAQTNLRSSSQKNYTIIAMDTAPHALSLMVANAKANNHAKNHDVLVPAIANFTDLASLRRLKRDHHLMMSNENDTKYGFDVVLGSSLQSLFREDTSHPDALLWQALDTLMDDSNPNHHPNAAIAILVHTTVESLQPPSDGSFHLLKRISGEVLGMRNRHVHVGGGDGPPSSDFEVAVFARGDDYGTRDGEQRRGQDDKKKLLEVGDDEL